MESHRILKECMGRVGSGMSVKRRLVLILCATIVISTVLVLHRQLTVDGLNASSGSSQAPHIVDADRQAAQTQHAAKKQEQTVKPTDNAGQKPAAQKLPQEKKLAAPFVSQNPQLPNGCEITSLTMLLQSAGIKVTKMSLASQIKKVPFQSGGYMGNPNQGFVGNMYHGSRSNPGLAVYHRPIAELARKYLGNRVVDFSGSSWLKVEQQLAAGHPVWVITSIHFQPVPAANWLTWRTRSGTIQITYQEHSVLVTGYDQNEVYFNDPMSSQAGSHALKSSFVAAWRQFGCQAVTYH